MTEGKWEPGDSNDNKSAGTKIESIILTINSVLVQTLKSKQKREGKKNL